VVASSRICFFIFDITTSILENTKKNINLMYFQGKQDFETHPNTVANSMPRLVTTDFA
jgi:hypothetical protein